MTAVFVATADGLLHLGSERSSELEGRAVRDFAVDGDAWWAIADRSTIMHKPAGGAWTEATVVKGRTLKCLLPTTEGVFVGTDRAHLFSVTGGDANPVAAFEDAPGRDEWFTPWGGPPDVRSLAAGPNGIYANVHVGGILRSGDAGASWLPTIDIGADVHEVITTARDGDEIVLAAAAVGLAVSRDAGATWDVDDDGLHSSYARAVAVVGDDLLMTAATGPFGGRAGIYKRSLDERDTFRKVHDGLPEWFPDNIDTARLDARIGSAAFGTADGNVYSSGDGGESWELIADGLEGIGRVRILD